MPFFEFSQNNSGGSFVTNDDLAPLVVIEADTAKKANKIAKSLGIYFNGCNKGLDCPCCGDRWYSQDEDNDGDEVPSSYGTPLKLHEGKKKRDEVIVHYQDGTKKYGGSKY